MLHPVTSADPRFSDHPIALTAQDWARVCRDLAFSEIASMPGLSSRLGPRLAAPRQGLDLDWSADGLALDSLARMQLATTAATWCNAYDAGYEDLFLAKRSAADWAVAMQRARAAGARHFTFATSGTTGKRQHIRHREDTLLSEAAVWAQVVSSEPPPLKRIIVLAPTHHIYGFIWGVLLPQVLSLPVIDAALDDLPTLQTGDLIVAVPDQWAWLADAHQRSSAHSQGLPRWPEGVQGISSTAPLPHAVHTALCAPGADGTAGLARLLQIYGSTETAGLAWRDSPTQPYALAPGRSRSASDQIQLMLPSGQLALMNIQDELQWTGVSQFDLLRRLDHSVQVGGHNVSLAWVTQLVQAHPAVREVSVRLDTQVTPGRLKAFVVLEAPADMTMREELAQWVADNLPWYASFHTITYGPTLPRNQTGKPSDWQPDPWLDPSHTAA